MESQIYVKYERKSQMTCVNKNEIFKYVGKY